MNRIKVGVSQRELSKLLRFTKTGQYVSNIERQLCSIPPKKIKLFAKVLEITEREVIEAMISDYRDYLENYELIDENQIKIEEPECKISEPVTTASSVTQELDKETTTSYTAENQNPNTQKKFGTMSQAVEDAIEQFFAQNP